MNAALIVVVVVAAVLIMSTLLWTARRASVPDRLAGSALVGSGSASFPIAMASTDRPSDRPRDPGAAAGAEDQYVVDGDAAPGPPAHPAPPTTVPSRQPVDPDAPGRSVDDTDAARAVEPNEPA